MSDRGRAVLDAERVQHIASPVQGLSYCGAEYVALDLHWAETTRIHCTVCLEEARDQGESPPRDSA